jgi:3D-(3,5/4)-trihydroxycyclohexane-1,2-dione acylhydrolase (decyclizing)
VLYSEATDALQRFVDATGVPVGETQAGKGSLPDPHALCLGGIGATGTRAANALARDADLVIVIGSRLSDFTTASKTAFQREHVCFIAVNVAEIDAGKHAAIPLVGDARATLDELLQLLEGYRVSTEYTETIAAAQKDWRAEVDRVCNPQSTSNPQSAFNQHSAISNQQFLVQAHVIGVLQDTLAPTDVIVCAAGSLPGDLHKLWRARDPKGYHMEYGYSCMGYEIAGGLGVKMAAPDRRVYVLVGDGSYLMMAQEIVTAVQERVAMTIVLLDNHGFASIGGLSESVGSGGFGTRYRARNPDTGELDGGVLPIDLAANAASLGATVWRADTIAGLRAALAGAAGHDGVGVIVVPVDRESRVGGYESWWDVPVAEVSATPAVQGARAAYEVARRKAREFL